MTNPIQIPMISLAIVLCLANLTTHKDAKSKLNHMLKSKSQNDSLHHQVALTALLKPLKLPAYLDKPVKSKTVLIYISTLLVSQSTNVEANPGPAVSQYPCGYCKLEVTWSQKGIYCDECGIWYHTDCQGIGDGTYDKLSESKHVWLCLNCCLPNYSSSLLDRPLTLLQMQTVSHRLNLKGWMRLQHFCRQTTQILTHQITLQTCRAVVCIKQLPELHPPLNLLKSNLGIQN